MNISKHLHSCLLVEEQNKTFLIDPGIFTYQEKALDINQLQKLDYILITHEHPDHMHLPFIKELVVKFPDVKIISNPSVVSLLQKEALHARTTGDEIVTVETIMHEQLWDKQAPQNTVFTIYGKLTHPGDSHHVKKSAEILALPIIAPWGSTAEAVSLALRLKPKVIIPIHDWMWKDGVRQSMYQRLAEFFKTREIDFKAIETGEIIEI